MSLVTVDNYAWHDIHYVNQVYVEQNCPRKQLPLVFLEPVWKKKELPPYHSTVMLRKMPDVWMKHRLLKIVIMYFIIPGTYCVFCGYLKAGTKWRYIFPKLSNKITLGVIMTYYIRCCTAI
uniref:Uncharacterized protein n=1 Tax=Glossina palpalis gambiensis TaxID=67801 RepID=A0A1B0BJ88_9MUSC